MRATAIRLALLGVVFTLGGCALCRVSPPPLAVTKTDETDNRRRLIVIPTADLVRAQTIIPLAEDFRVLGPSEDDPASSRVLTYEFQMEWIRSAGIEIIAEMTQVPRRDVDPTFAARASRTPSRDAAGGLVVNDGYKDAAMVEALLRAFARLHPEITRLHEIGRTHQGRPVLALLITDNPDVEEDEPAFFFNGAHHGSELLSIEPVLDIIEYLTERHATDAQVRAWVEANEIWCVPLVNPDGLDRHWHLADSTGRNNGRDLDGDGETGLREGVDLNRNYPFLWNSGVKRASGGEPGAAYYRGPLPGSEPETQAVMRLAGAQRFVMAISCHTAATSVLVPYTIDKALNPEPSAAWVMAEEFTPLLESHRPSRPYRVRRMLYSVDGTDQDWHMHAHGTQAFLIELPRHNPDYATWRDRIVEGARPMWQWMLDRLARGPTLSGHVVDAATGAPLEAVVRLEEIRWHHGERHTSHPTTGRFDRILPAPGVYHVRAEREGYRSRTVEVEVGEEWREVEVALEPGGGGQ